MALSPALAHWLAARGHDAVHAAALGLDRAADAEIMARATRDARTVVTADLDYPRLLALAGAAGPNLILFRGGNWSETDVVARVQQGLRSFGARGLTTSLDVVDCRRLRRRTLSSA